MWLRNQDGEIMTDSNHRSSDYPIDRLFLDRWSPRAFSGETIADEDLLALLEASRWAPSASNRQPWRFVYGLKGKPAFETMLSLLNEGNQVWARNASALIFVISDTLSRRPDGSAQPSRTHSFDAGAAWGFLALQATLSGLATHAMAGVDFDRAAEALQVPDDHHIEAAVAIGRTASALTLPAELQAREVPSQRRPLSALAFEGVFLSE